MKNIMLVIGTRPEAIKMCPLVYELRKIKDFNVKVCATGQHKEMLNQVFDAFNIVPDYNLNIMKKNQDLFDITNSILNKIKVILENEKTSLVLVHGDTTTAFISALAAFYLKIPVGHVEAGLRTYDSFSPYPEEFNRQAIDSLTSYYFCPTESAKTNLLNEKKNIDNIFVTGNTAIDALKTTVRKDYTHYLLEWAKDSRLILMTVHRRENLGKAMYDIFTAIRKLIERYEDIKVVYPVHLNPRIKEIADDVFSDCPRIKLVQPLDVVDFHNIMAKSYFIVTDSGGIQEEAPSLKVPVLIARNTTERTEGLSAGVTKIIGTDLKNIYDTCCDLLDSNYEYNSMISDVNPYGDGKASERITNIICELMK